MKRELLSWLPCFRRIIGSVPGALLLFVGVGASGCRSGSAVQTPGEHLRTMARPAVGKAEESEPPSTSVAPSVPPGVAERTIDLETVLGLTGASNPTIALAMEAIRAGEAERLQAQTLLLPTLNAGASANVHRGNLQNSQGIIRDVDRQSAYVGAGAGAVGSGTVAYPGVRVTAPLGDAVFEPRVARQRVEELRFTSDAMRNRVLLEAVTRFLALAGAEARIAALRASEVEVGEVVRLTANFARTGQGRQGDADRAQSEAHLLHTQTQQAEEEGAVAAAALAQVLSADPSVRLHAPGGLPQICLVNPELDLETLVQMALRSRPEIGAAQAAIRVGTTRLRQERVRPFVPTVSAGFSAGGFGGGSDQVDTRFGHFNGRTDFDVLAFWTLQNLGLGNAAVQKERRAQLNAARAQQLQAIDQVRREVAEALAFSAAQWREVEVARRRIGTAQQGFRQDLARARNLQGRPIELLNSLNLLTAARQDFIRALVGYNEAQFRLFVALGSPPRTAP